MKQEKVYIVLSHKHNLKKRARKDQWEVSEVVEFVSQLKNRHISNASAIGDYINRKMIKGASRGMPDYTNFEQYIRNKYADQMFQLDTAYSTDRKEDSLAPLDQKDSTEVKPTESK